MDGLELAPTFRPQSPEGTPGFSAPTFFLSAGDRGRVKPALYPQWCWSLGHQAEQDWGTGREGIHIH